MDLLEVFKPTESDVLPDGRRWNLGFNMRSRACGAHLRLADACSTATIDLVGTDTSRPVSYHVNAFPIQLELLRAVNCILPDDNAWSLAALRDANEYALGRALVTQPIGGTDSWTGNAGVQTVTLVATPTANDLRLAVIAARKLWYSTVVGVGPPTIHIPPSLVPLLLDGNVLVSRAIDGELAEVWGDTIVVNAGYESAVPRVFFSGPIDIYLAPARDDSPVAYFRVNDNVVMVDEVAAIDVPPCSIVRVGAYT